MPWATPSDWIAFAAGTVSVIAVGVSLYTVRRSNLNSSVATLVVLNEGFCQAWRRYFAAPEDAKDHEFYELLNLLEIACGIHCERSLFGISRELSRDYIEHVLLLIEQDLDARERLEAAIHTPSTFKYVRMFRTEMRKRRPHLGILSQQ